MQIRKTYKMHQPGAALRGDTGFHSEAGRHLGENKMETYTLPDQSASFGTRATLTFNAKGAGGAEKECLRAHIVGLAKGETKLMIDVDDKAVPGG